MRFTLLFFAVVSLVTACRPHRDSADGRMQKQLSGTWRSEAKYASGHNTEITWTVNTNGSYVCTVMIPNRTNGPRIVTLEGSFRVESAFLVDTTTNDSQNYASVSHPVNTRYRIVRIDDRELVLENESERLPGHTSPTNPLVFLKQIK